jgi:hypothetical protein
METNPPSSTLGGAWDSHGDTADVATVDASLPPARAVPATAAAASHAPFASSGGRAPADSPHSSAWSSDSNGGRNVTVLPAVESSGESLRLMPRHETRYQRVKPLGAGAMGEVSLVRDNDIGRTVAVKRLASPARTAEGIARFVDEIRTIGQLEHPNIVPIHDVGVDEQGQIFFVMKHIDGETLASIIRKLDHRDPEYCARYTMVSSNSYRAREITHTGCCRPPPVEGARSPLSRPSERRGKCAPIAAIWNRPIADLDAGEELTGDHAPAVMTVMK